MALDPSIALGVKPLEVANPLAQYGQVAQLQHYQQQNALAQRAMGQEDAMNQAYANSIDATTGQIDPNKLRQNMAAGGVASKLPAAEKSIMEGRKLGGEVNKLEYENSKNKYDRSINDIINFDTHDQILGALADKVKTGELTQQQGQQLAGTVPQDPRDIPAWQIKTTRGLLSAKDKLEQHFASQDTGAGSRLIATPKYGGGPAQVVEGSTVKKTATIADNLAREKFNFERTNPGFELKESEDGTMVGVNKRTLQAFPVTMGGAAPSTAPAAGGPRVPPTATAAPNVQVIPGMNSVLDQPAATVPPAGGPLKGKGTALTETQGNATAFGMRMKESNSILEDLAKKGVLRGANVEATPLIGGALGKVLPSALGGTSEAQQQLNQAKENFITANLRKESGATILDSEFEREDRKYFPQLNDSPKTLKQKADARKLAIETMMIQAGPGSRNIRDLKTSGGNSSSDPLGLMGR
jgi:hypothetical protein